MRQMELRGRRSDGEGGVVKKLRGKSFEGQEELRDDGQEKLKGRFEGKEELRKRRS